MTNQESVTKISRSQNVITAIVCMGITFEDISNLVTRIMLTPRQFKLMFIKLDILNCTWSFGRGKIKCLCWNHTYSYTPSFRFRCIIKLFLNAISFFIRNLFTFCTISFIQQIGPIHFFNSLFQLQKDL